jgi:hypothetical protein
MAISHWLDLRLHVVVSAERMIEIGEIANLTSVASQLMLRSPSVDHSDPWARASRRSRDAGGECDPFLPQAFRQALESDPISEIGTGLQHHRAMSGWGRIADVPADSAFSFISRRPSRHNGRPSATQRYGSVRIFGEIGGFGLSMAQTVISVFGGHKARTLS